MYWLYRPIYSMTEFFVNNVYDHYTPRQLGPKVFSTPLFGSSTKIILSRSICFSWLYCVQWMVYFSFQSTCKPLSQLSQQFWMVLSMTDFCYSFYEPILVFQYWFLYFYVFHYWRKLFLGFFTPHSCFGIIWIEQFWIDRNSFFKLEHLFNSMKQFQTKNLYLTILM